MIFVDTSAWFAAFVPNDPNHLAAHTWLTQNSEQLLTTDYVLDELLTLLKMRREFSRAFHIGENLLDESISRLEWISTADVRAAWQVFSRFHDKKWSFTDCVSRVVMDRLGIQCAFAFDDHFRQFGTVNVVPVLELLKKG